MEKISSSTKNSTVYIALLAIFTALTAVITAVVAIPFPTTSGYLNIGDMMVMLSGMLLGPVGGLIAGGVGSGMADVALGYLPFAPITLIVKGFEGFIVGLFSLKSKKAQNLTRMDAIGIVLAAIAMLLGYFVFESILFGPVAAWEELVSINWIQVTVGGIFTGLFGPKIRSYLHNASVTLAEPGEYEELELSEIDA
ncbi:MAG: Thiamine transporter HmpT [Candidatus Thorarchaeota archaeon]|nr:MAG: Thiamine transporter HmpT [Candidatus Thorarchaeota archaeon]